MTSPDLHRRSIRLPGRDYAFPDRYFVTICAAHRRCILGHIQDGAMNENQLGRLARACWMEIPLHFVNVELDDFVVMPNHVHGLILLHRKHELRGARNSPTKRGHDVSCPYKSSQRNRETQEAFRKAVVSSEHCEARTEAFGKPVAASVATIIRTFKAAVTREARRKFGIPRMEVWQRNYFERVVRDDHEYAATHRYICENPHCWETDPENPQAKSL